MSTSSTDTDIFRLPRLSVASDFQLRTLFPKNKPSLFTNSFEPQLRNVRRVAASILHVNTQFVEGGGEEPGEIDDQQTTWGLFLDILQHPNFCGSGSPAWRLPTGMHPRGVGGLTQIFQIGYGGGVETIRFDPLVFLETAAPDFDRIIVAVRPLSSVPTAVVVPHQTAEKSDETPLLFDKLVDSFALTLVYDNGGGGRV